MLILVVKVRVIFRLQNFRIGFTLRNLAVFYRLLNNIHIISLKFIYLISYYSNLFSNGCKSLNFYFLVYCCQNQEAKALGHIDTTDFNHCLKISFERYGNSLLYALGKN